MFLKEYELENENDFINRCKPHSKQVEDYVETFIAPDLIAFYIASGFYLSSIYEQKLETLITTGLEFLNITIKNRKKLIKNIINILKIKYNLNVLNNEPLILEDFYK